MTNAHEVPTPTAEQVRGARKNAGLSQRAAGDVVYLSRRAWQAYEEGTTEIKLAVWELFLFKTGQLFLRPLSVATQPRRAHPGRVENLRPIAANQ